MDLKFAYSSLFASVFWFLCVISCANGQNEIFRITDYGAVSDGKTDNTNALMSAWKEACATNGGVVSIPNGIFFLRGAVFEGPCIGETYFMIKGTLIASDDASLDDDYWILFHKVDGLTVFGNGTFDGNGAKAWSYNTCDRSTSCKRPPSSIRLNTLRNTVVREINLLNSKMFHLTINECDNLSANSIDIRAPADSPNTDGIHIARSNNVRVTDSRISTGDDCVSMGDGNTNVNITKIWCGPGHGISIGSLGKYKEEKDVSGIFVDNCTFTKTDNGLRIKTWAPSTVSTTVSDVTFSNILMDDVENPIVIDQYYCPNSLCSHQGESDIEIRGVKFVNIKGSSESKVAVDVQCSKKKPCKNIEFVALNLTTKATGQPTTASCSNADHKFIDPSVQVPSKCS
ncbi:hypothetical protein ACP275_09G046600 [Erythranthe tilingii]